MKTCSDLHLTGAPPTILTWTPWDDDMRREHGLCYEVLRVRDLDGHVAYHAPAQSQSGIIVWCKVRVERSFPVQAKYWHLEAHIMMQSLSPSKHQAGHEVWSVSR